MKRNKLLTIFVILLIGTSVYIFDINVNIIRNYLADLCWVVAFTLTVSLFTDNLIEIILIPIICGIMLEIGQYYHLILGTGDILDVFVETSACLITGLIIRRENEKE